MNLPKSQRCRPAGRLDSASPKTALARGSGRGYPARHEKPEIADDTGGQLRRNISMVSTLRISKALGTTVSELSKGLEK